MPLNTAVMIYAGYDVPSCEKSDETTTLVSMTAKSLFASCITDIFDFSINFVECHFGNSSFRYSCSHGSECVQRILSLLCFSLGTDFKRNAALPYHCLHENIDGGCGA